MSEKSILKSFTISVIFCAALFTSCDLFFNNKKQDNFTDDVPPAKVESEHNFEIQITLNPRILEHGAIPFEASEYNSSDSSQAISNLSSRSAAFVPEGTISNLNITATRKKDGNGTAIAEANQTAAAGNKITGTGNATNQTFNLKINKTGTWLIEVSFNIDGTTYSGKEVIKLTTETSYKVGLAIFAYAQDISLSTDAFGTVKLVTEYEENLTADTPSLLPQAAQIKLKKRNGTDGTEESNSYLINGIINSTERTVTFQKQIPSGIYFAEIAFFSDVERLSPLYTCKETLLIADNKTTDTWVISSSYLEQDGEDSSSIIKNEKDGPLQVKDGQVHFIITSELVKAFVQKYDGPEFYVDADNGSDYNKGSKAYPFATVQKAVDRILAVNDKHSQYTILLKSDVVEDQNAASYEEGRKYSYIKIIGNGTSASETQIKITSDSEALAAYNSLYLIEKEGFSIDANRDNSHRGAVIWAQKVMLSLESVTVRGGYYGSYTSTPCAAGIHLTGAAKLTMEKNACIENNTQVRDTSPKKTVAGVYVASNCTFVMNGGVIRNNVNLMDQEHSAGGVLVAQNAEFIMNPLKDDNGNEITCAIYGNRGMAGAIAVISSGVFTMNGGVIGKPSSQVTQAADASHWGNKAEIIGSTGGKGGAILLLADTNGAPKVYLNGGEICYNYAEKEGGAIACLDGNASHLVELNGTYICYNSAGPNSDAGKGGAIYAESAEINMYKGQIYGNRAGGTGGAIYLEAASAFDPDEKKLNLNISGGKITDNLVKNGDPQPANNSATPPVPATGVKALGGAIYLGANASCQLNGGIIDQNKTYASNTSSGESYGGAIYMETLFDGTFETYTPTSTATFAPHLYINGGFINANVCEAATVNATKRGSGIYTAPVLYTISNTTVISSNNDVFDSMVYVKGTTTSADISSDVGTTNFNGVTNTIGDLYVCDHEVTQAEFKIVAGGHSSNFDGTTGKEAAEGEIQNNRPVEKVNWFDAVVYCNKLSILEGLEPYYRAFYSSNGSEVTDWNSMVYSSETIQSLWGLSDNFYTTSSNGYRLPTCLEWEYAARDGISLHSYNFAGTSGTTQTALDAVAWNNDTKTHEVKKKAPNALGLYDMTGNVREWCEDPGTGSRSRYVYGGYYSGGLTTLTISSSKSSVTFDFRSNDNLGFRVVRNAPSSSSSTTQKCIVTFDTTTNWPGNTTKVPPQEVFSGGKASAPSISDPTPLVSGEQKHGNFLGWYTKPKPAQNPADPSVTPITPIDSPFDFENTPITTNLTLYAVWDFVYVQGATFDGNSTLCAGVTEKESAIFIEDRVLPIGNLWVCDHEVTQSEYSTYIGFNYSSLDPVGNNYPAYQVTWYDAVIYCNLRSKAEGLTPVYYLVDSNGNEVENGREVSTWAVVETQITRNGNKYKYNPASDSSKLDYKGADDTDGGICFDQSANGYRLPTEAEWEYIAREGNLSDSGQTPYSGSDNINDVAWYIGNASEKSKTVKTKRANNLGIYDMSGNLREWCWDWHSTITAETPETGPLSSNVRIFRGGSWEVSAGYHQNNNRASNVTNYTTYNILGFRLVRNAEGPAQATPVKHTVTFDTTTNWSGSSLSIEPVQVYDGKKVSRPSGSPADNSVNFRGWFTKPNPSATDTPFNFNTTAINRDLTLYAVYDFVYVAGDVFNSSTTLCAEDDDRVSSVFIGGQFIQLDSLYFCNHEVTQGEYEKYCCYTGTPPSEDEYGNGADYPVYYVSWYDAIVYCNLRSIAEGLTPCYSLGGNTTTTNWTGIKTVTEGGNTKYSCNYTTSIASWNNIVCDWNANGYRLPTIVEWEYAARGGNLTSTGQTIYCGTDGTGDDLGNYAWYGGNSSNITHPVKGKLPNALNLYDMTGNVSELCWDWHPADNTLKAVRSCGFFEAFKLNAMGSDVPYGRRNFIGFRVVRSAGLSNPSVQAKCTVTFDTKTNRPDSSLTIEPVKVNAGKKIKQPSQTPSDPVQFRGWFTKANPSATDTPFNFNTTSITRDLTLYAVWDFVYVEGGTVVGSDDYNQNKDSGTSYISAFPEGRTVTLSSFYMCDHELTQGEYETYCCYTSATPSSSKGGGADYPAYYISWYDAIVYCNLRSMAENLTPCYVLGDETDPTKWNGIKSSNGKYSCSYTDSNSTWNSITCNMEANGYRLPTEAEWEYAARGGQETYGNGTSAFANYFAGATTTNYSASSNIDLDPVAWYSSNSSSKTQEVKKKAKNALGLYDMSGNVYEWCWDWKGSISTSETVTNPYGASSGSNRVIRGGSWDSDAYGCSVSCRNNYPPNNRVSFIGFRLVRSAR